MAVIYDMSHIDAMEGHEFEQLIANLLRKLGYQKVEVTPGSGDQGVDVLAEKDGVRYAIQCKCYSSDLGNTPVQEVNTGKVIYHCHVGVVVTNRYFTQGAQEAAKATGVLLWDRSKLTALIAQAKMDTSAKISTQQKEETLILWNGSPLLRRGGIALKDGDWKKARQFFDRVLNTDPENAEAYLGLVMAETELPNQLALAQMYINQPWRLRNNNFYHAKEFAGPELKAWFANLDIQRRKKEEKDEAERKSKIAKAEAERKRKEAEAEERRQQKIAERYSAAIEQVQVTCDSKEPDDLYAVAKALRSTARKFRSLGTYRDSLQRAESCEQRATRLEKEADMEVAVRAEQERLCKEENAKKQAAQNRKAAGIIAIVTVIAIIVTVVMRQSVIPKIQYRAAEELLVTGNILEAAMVFNSLGDFEDAQAKSLDAWGRITERKMLAAGKEHIVGLKSDGTVVAAGNNERGQCDVSNWTNIVAVSAGRYSTIGLRSDGTVAAVGSKYSGQSDVNNWTDIVSISVGQSQIIGLKSNGTAVAVGTNYDGECNVNDWSNIVAVSAGGSHTIGLKSDGTVVLAGERAYFDGASNWTDIVAVSAGDFHSVGLKSDGTVVAVGSNKMHQCDVKDWSNIVAVSAGVHSTIGLKSDGTVVAVGSNYYGQCDVSDWANIVAICAGDYEAIGLRSDGTVVATGFNKDGLSDWLDIKLPEREMPNE